jgi:hypothetical protein
MRRHAFGFVLLAVTIGIGGCNDGLRIETQRPNLPPDTQLTSGPPDSTYATTYRVQLAWTGSDADGSIARFEWILVDHLAIQDSITGPVDDPMRVVVTVPGADDPRWTSTTGRDTIVVSSADTLRSDPRPPPGSGDGEIGEHNRLVRLRSFERWHTFFVRAIDDKGTADPSPDYLSFNSTTLAPEVQLLPPIDPVYLEHRGARQMAVHWTGRDPIDGTTFTDPIASRWVVMPTRKTLDNRYVGYPDDLYQLPSGSEWSMWRRWDAADGSGRRAELRDLRPVDGTGSGYYLFAVQAMDEAGAVTPVFDATTPEKNNVVRILVLDSIGPTLIVDETFLGQFSFAADSRPVMLAVAAGQPIRFRWRGDASAYGGVIVRYRYGLDIPDPDQEPGWVDCGECTELPVTLRLQDAMHTFHIETTDDLGTSVRAAFEIVVHPVTRGRDLLLVDDTDTFPGDPANMEAMEDARWIEVVDSLRTRQPFAFDRLADVYDVVASRYEPPPIAKVFDYKSIVWNARIAGSGITALGQLARFFDPFVERNRDRVVPYNYLATYVDNGGEFWLSGAQTTHQLWSFAPGELRPYPFNVTNWDDPIEPHPGIDSVGTRSFLWRMGAEAVDVGGGGLAPTPRQTVAHFCVGFHRTRLQGSERQTFVSSRQVDHEHALDVLEVDVDTAPEAGVTYTTATQLQHSHTVTLTRNDLLALSRGSRIAVATSEAQLPVPHTHTFDLFDAVGTWGAPLRLEPDWPVWAQPADPLLNPAGGRPGVEIYNMPAFLATQMPPLLPDPRVWTAPYAYTSATPADPGAGVVYPVTADGMPAVLLRRATPVDRDYSRAMCGFEVWRLRRRSHLALADYVLLRHFRLGQPEPN